MLTSRRAALRGLGSAALVAGAFVGTCQTASAHPEAELLGNSPVLEKGLTGQRYL